MLVIVCPGQGAQTPGMLGPWLEVPGVRDHVMALSDAAQIDLLAHGTESDEETIKDTAVAQPLIVASGLVTLRALLRHSETAVTTATEVAGHSVGEITAAAAAGALTEQEAMTFVAARGRAMAAASAVEPTGMSAVLGGDQGEVLRAIERHDLTAANRNGAGQIVAAGTLSRLKAFGEDAPAKARVVPLKVAGAFHTTYMQPAVGELIPVANSLHPRDPIIPLTSNRDGTVLMDGPVILDRLVSQVSNPVRWDLIMDRFDQQGVTAMIEVAPGGTLVGLAKRALRGLPTVALRTPDDLPAAAALIAEHGSEVVA